MQQLLTICTAIELNYTFVSIPFGTLHSHLCKYYSVSILGKKLHNVYDATLTLFTQNNVCNMFIHTAENLQPLHKTKQKTNEQ